MQCNCFLVLVLILLHSSLVFWGQRTCPAASAGGFVVLACPFLVLGQVRPGLEAGKDVAATLGATHAIYDVEPWKLWQWRRVDYPFCFPFGYGFLGGFGDDVNLLRSSKSSSHYVCTAVCFAKIRNTCHIQLPRMKSKFEPGHVYSPPPFSFPFCQTGLRIAILGQYHLHTCYIQVCTYICMILAA